MANGDARQRALEFLRVAHLYGLGDLPTERPHPATRSLSTWARSDLPRAVSALARIDVEALAALERRAAEIDRLAAAIRSTLAAGHRAFLCGCGATGRLSLSLEHLWRGAHPGSDQVRAFMAGGDVALVHSLEGFEDRPEFGARHLVEAGFGDGDLLVACTEGGETPYVIGATQRAAELSSNRPFFLYCNPDAALEQVERFRQLRGRGDVHAICLDVGPMALAGSTRMQASTVLQLAVGLALLHPSEPAATTIRRFKKHVEDTDLAFLADFVRLEAGVYAAGQSVLYRVRDFGITVFTDTTERAPTFSLRPFQQGGPGGSLCYVVLDEASRPAEAWSRLLHRAPRPLEWPEVDPRTTSAYLQGFDFSVSAAQRTKAAPARHEFHIRREGAAIRFELAGLARDIPIDGLPPLFEHLLLKQMLNIHSTLVMGRLGRYEGNLMTWVTPTNGKLVDRAARCVTHLLRRDGVEPIYEQVVRQLFVELERAAPDESVVLRTAHALRAAAARRNIG